MDGDPFAQHVEAMREQVSLLREHVDASPPSARAPLEEAVAVLDRSLEALRQAEESLKASEARKAAVLESALDCIITIDAADRIVEFNPASERTFGYPRDAVLGQDMAEFLVPPGLREAQHRGLERYLETGEKSVLNRRVEVPARRADGSEFPAELSVIPIDVNGDAFFTAYLRDITEPKRAERALRESHDLLRAVIESTPDAIFVKDRDGRYLLINPAGAAFLGAATVEEVLGKTDDDFFAPPSARVNRQNDRRIMERGEAETYEDAGTASGVTRAFLTTKGPYRDRAGNIVGVVGISRDITERKQAEEALKTSEGRYHRVVTNAPGMVFQYARRPDGSTRFPFVSEGCREIYGLEPAEIERDAGRIIDIIHPDDRPAFDRSVDVSAATLAPWKWEGRIVLPSGEQKWLQGASRPERQENGDIVWDGLLMDITERKRAEHVARGQTAALSSTLNALTARPELDTFLGQVLSAITEPLKSCCASLWFYDREQVALFHHMTYDDGRLLEDGTAGEPCTPDEVPRWQEMVRSHQPVVVMDANDEDRASPCGGSQRLAPAETRALLLVPLHLDGEMIGLLSIHSDEPRRFLPEEMELTRALAQQVTLAVQLTRLAERGRQTAVLHERNRLAREIHDTLAQGFTGILVQLDAAEDALDAAPGEAQDHLARARDLARVSLAEARRSVWALRPQVLEHRGLPEALADLTRRMTHGTPVRPDFHVRGTARALPPEVESNLLRIGLEALTNALKHAGASAVRIEADFEPGEVRLSVQDNGRGFDPHRHPPGGGFGLTGMQERADSIGGRLQIISRPGGGTEVVVRAPA